MPTEITPIVIVNNFSKFLEKNNLLNQIEKRGNKGFVDSSFELMMEKVGWISGQAWCAYYVKLVFMQMLSFDRDFLAKNFTGGAANNYYAIQSLNKQGDKRYLAISSGTPQIGDIFCQGVSGNGHTGIVIENLGGNKVKTIEGNTNLKGSREGDRVLSLTRDLIIGGASQGKKNIGFIRRNYTPQEIANLYYNDAKQTFILK
jgi:hypothetical protein